MILLPVFLDLLLVFGIVSTIPRITTALSTSTDTMQSRLATYNVARQARHESIMDCIGRYVVWLQLESCARTQNTFNYNIFIRYELHRF